MLLLVHHLNKSIRFLDKYPSEKLYHVSSDGGLIEMIARIPSNAMLFEDKVTKRICFSKNLEGCLKARWDFLTDPTYSREYYVYAPTNLSEIFIYNDDLKNLVPDAYMTGEIWITNKKITVDRIGKVCINSVKLNNKIYITKNNWFNNEAFKYSLERKGSEPYSFIYEAEIKYQFLKCA